MADFMVSAGRYILPLICLIVLAYCLTSLLRNKTPKVEPASFVDPINGKEFPITSWETSIGRSNSCDIVLGAQTVSRFHAVLSKHKKGWIITDTLSHTGTYVNSVKIDNTAVIHDGETVTFGSASLVFRER